MGRRIGRTTRIVTLVVVVVGVVGVVGVGGVAACGAAPATHAPVAVGAQVQDLAGGRLDALPSGPLYMRVQSFMQDPGTSFGSRLHQPGFEYQVTGLQHLVIQGGPTVAIRAGEGYFQLSVAHDHVNPGPSPNSWFFLAMWPTSARTAPLVTSSSKIVYETEDLPPNALRPGAYAETLQQISLTVGGHTSVERFAGVRLLFVLAGTVRVRRAGGSETVPTEAGTYVVPGTASEVENDGSVPARLLAFTITPAGKPFEVQGGRL